MRIDLNLLKQKHIPLHVAINYDLLNDEDIPLIFTAYEYMTKEGFPILTVAINVDDTNIAVAKNFFLKLKESTIFDEQVRVFVIGDWYNLDHKFVEQIKYLIDNTKSFDRHFLNILINYDGKNELVSAVKLIAKKLELNHLKGDEVNETIIKENLFNSYFTPPELIIETKNKYSGLLLFDSKNSKIFFSNKKQGLLKEAITFFQS